MDSRHFDSLTKAVAAKTPRRLIVRGVAGTLLGGIMAWLGRGEAEAQKGPKACRKVGRSCRKPKGRPRPRCCPGTRCNGRKCDCKGGFKRCRNECIRRNQCCRNRDCDPGEKCDRRNHRCQRGPGPQTCTTNAQCPSGACGCLQAGRPPIPTAGQCQPDTFIQTFSANANGWFAFLDDENDANKNWHPPGTLNTLTVVGGEGRVAPVTNNDIQLSAASPLGGFSTVFPAGGFSTIIDVFFDPANTVDGESFSYSVAINQSGVCEFAAEYMFQGGRTGADTCVRIGGGGGSDPCAGDFEVIATAGFYRLTHVFHVVGGNVVVDQSATGPGGFSFFGAQQIVDPVGALGGNRYAWFPHNEFNPLRIRNSARANA